VLEALVDGQDHQLAGARERPTFAIISHPDAGKTTLTEKLLLYGGAIQLAGAVKRQAPPARHAVSDWMEMERERGISIQSSGAPVPYEGRMLSLVDTPGHADFSEDTYRALMATDAAIMLLDCAKGVEAQTKKLFRVCKLRKMPIFTFVNKMDRPAATPSISSARSRRCSASACTPSLAVAPARFRGVYHRKLQAQGLPLRADGARRGDRADGGHDSLDDPRIDEMLEPGDAKRLRDEVELLDSAPATRSIRRSSSSAGVTPMFFGSAINNFGLPPVPRLVFVEMMPMPAAARLRQGRDRAQDERSRLRLQDPGEHGSRAPRPRRVPARLLGPLRARDEGEARPPRPRHPPHEPCAVPGRRSGPWSRTGYRRRHHRRLRSGHLPHRRHQYGVDLKLGKLPYTIARWPLSGFDPDDFRYSERIRIVRDRDDRWALLAHSPWDLDRLRDRNDSIVLSETPDPTLFERAR
jgi:small GTP-binding protein